MRADWIERELGQVCNIVSGGTPKGVNEITNNGRTDFYKVSD